MFVIASNKQREIEMKCSICGNEIEEVLMGGNSVWTEGHNAQPVNDGRCCGSCNDTVVIPRRLNDSFHAKYVREGEL